MKPILKIYMNYFEKLDKLFYCKQGILELEICYQWLMNIIIMMFQKIYFIDPSLV